MRNVSGRGLAGTSQAVVWPELSGRGPPGTSQAAVRPERRKPWSGRSPVPAVFGLWLSTDARKLSAAKSKPSAAESKPSAAESEWDSK
jgi:hypothetical protein